MLENLAKEFLTSAVAGDTVNALKSEAGLDQGQATNALSATAEGAVQALGGSGGLAGALGGLLGGGGGGGGVGDMLGGLLGGGNNAPAAPQGGGVGDLLGGLLGGGNAAPAAPAGGGLGDMLGGMLGGGGGGGGVGDIVGGMLGGSNSGIPGPVVDAVAKFVAEKTGLDPTKAKLAVNVALPKIMAFVKSKMG